MELAKVIKEKNTPRLGDWIKLNVGGVMFETSRATLTQVPDSLLGKMFDPDSSLPPARMQDGAFLIDFSPSSFPVILHWLRCREVALGEVTVETALSAARYFGLQALLEALEEISKKEKEPESDWIKLNADGTIFQSSRATLIWGGGLLAKMFDPSHSDYCPPPRDSNGAYLIECKPQIFSKILEMLRKKSYAKCPHIEKDYEEVYLASKRFVSRALPRDYYPGYLEYIKMKSDDE